jgi:hypothetical protein
VVGGERPEQEAHGGQGGAGQHQAPVAHVLEQARYRQRGQHSAGAVGGQGHDRCPLAQAQPRLDHDHRVHRDHGDGGGGGQVQGRHGAQTRRADEQPQPARDALEHGALARAGGGGQPHPQDDGGGQEEADHGGDEHAAEAQHHEQGGCDQRAEHALEVVGETGAR